MHIIIIIKDICIRRKFALIVASAPDGASSRCGYWSRNSVMDGWFDRMNFCLAAAVLTIPLKISALSVNGLA